MGMGVDVQELAELGLYREAKLVDRYVGQGLEEPPPPDWECTRCAHAFAGNPRFCPNCGYTVYSRVRCEEPDPEPHEEPCEARPAPPYGPASVEGGGTCG